MTWPFRRHRRGRDSNRTIISSRHRTGEVIGLRTVAAVLGVEPDHRVVVPQTRRALRHPRTERRPCRQARGIHERRLSCSITTATGERSNATPPTLSRRSLAPPSSIRYPRRSSYFQVLTPFTPPPGEPLGPVPDPSTSPPLGVGWVRGRPFVVFDPPLTLSG